MVRRLQGLSRQTLRAAYERGSDRDPPAEETSDLPLSVLCAWQKVLDVPIAELLVDSEEDLSQPLMQRAQLVRLMKTAMSLLEQADDEGGRGLAQALVDRLIEFMPELQGISAWHAVGKRRTSDELGTAALRMCSEDLFQKHRAQG